MIAGHTNTVLPEGIGAFLQWCRGCPLAGEGKVNRPGGRYPVKNGHRLFDLNAARRRRVDAGRSECVSRDAGRTDLWLPCARIVLVGMHQRTGLRDKNYDRK